VGSVLKIGRFWNIEGTKKRAALPKYMSVMHIFFSISLEMFKTTFYNQGNLFGTKKYSTYLFVPMLTDRAADLYYLTFKLRVRRCLMDTFI